MTPLPEPRTQLPTESITDQVKRVIRSSLKLVPPLVYVPLKLRKKPVRVAGMHLTMLRPTADENYRRILDADPVGFLIAVMQGQPLPVFRVTEGAAEFEVTCHFDTPSPEARLNAAQFLASRANIQHTPEEGARYQHPRRLTEWEIAVNQAADSVVEAAVSTEEAN